MKSYQALVPCLLMSLVLLEPAQAEASPCAKGTEPTTEEGALRVRRGCVGEDLLGRRVRQGTQSVFEQGRLFCKGSYVDGRRHGEWTEYDAEGKLRSRWNYRFGTLISGRGPQPLPDAVLLTAARDSAPPRRTASAVSVPASAAPAAALPVSDTQPSGYVDVPGNSAFDQSGGTRSDSYESESAAGKDEYASIVVGSDFSFSRVAGASAYGWDLHADFRFASVTIRPDFGLGFISAQSEILTAVRNPTLFVLIETELEAVDVRYGVGLSAPVLRFKGGLDGAESLAVAGALSYTRGFWNVWEVTPSVVGLIAPIEVEGRVSQFTWRAEMAAFLPIPIIAASTDLGLQFAVDGGFALQEMLTVGARSQLVWLGVTNGVQGALSFEPYVAVNYDRFEARAGFQLTPFKPSVGGDSLVWATHIGVGARLM